jgi:type II secretory pathway pseudopilin PulG
MRKATPYLLLAAFLGALAWVAVPNLLLAKNRSNQKRTMADMRIIAQAIEARRMDTKTYGLTPADRPMQVAVGDLRPLRRVRHSELERALVPKYVKSVPRYDAWEHELDVRIAANTYVVRSLGSDGRAEADRYTPNKTTYRFEDDMVYSEGTFLQYPEGV